VGLFCLLSAFRAWSANCVTPPAGLVGWWAGQGNANDIAGTNNGTLPNGATFAPGEVGQAFSFNGSNQCVQVPYSQALVGPIYSVEAWIEPLSLPSGGINQAVIFGQSFGRSLLIARPGNSGVVILFGFGTSQVTFDWAVSTNEIPIGQFSHLVGTWDGTTLRLYVNGALNAQNTPGTSPVDPGCPFSIGGFYHSPPGDNCYYVGQFFNGLIDEVSYYNRVLTEAEIQALHDAGSAGKCMPPQPNCVPPPSGLVAWWRGEGNANDIMGSNSGTLSGGVTFTSGEVASAFSFNGTNSYVEVPDSPSLRLTNQLTIEFWVKRQDLQDGDCIANKGGDYTRSMLNYGVIINPPNWDNSLAFTFAGGARHSLSIADFKWHHCAVTASNGDVDPIFYVDGVQRAVTLRQGASKINLYPSTEALHIGAQVDPISGWNYYSGALVDEVSIYDRALSASEIAAIYNAGSEGKCRVAPTVRTATATATLVNDFVVGATITDGGYGYTNTPIVKIIGGGGSGAQAVAVVSNGVAIAVHFLDAGSGYTSTPLIVIDPPFIPNPVLDIAPMSFLVVSNLTLGGVYQLQHWVGWYWSNQPVSFTATNALYTQMVEGVADSGDYRLALNPVPAQAFAAAQVVNGFVVGAAVTSGGSGYVTSPAVTIVGAGGTNATAVSHISGGVVTSIAIIDAGNGYTNTPTVRIAPPPAAAVSPTVLPVMRVDSANLAPYDNYQIQFKPDLGGPWGNWNGGLFSPTDVTNSQYLFITNGVGFFRLQYVP